MAKVFSPPSELPPPDFEKLYTSNMRYKEISKLEEEWVQKLAEWCRKYGKGEAVGKEVHHGVGDGYARYMVLNERPLRLIHLPIGDNWSAGEIWERGLRLADVRRMTSREPLFGRSK